MDLENLRRLEDVEERAYKEMSHMAKVYYSAEGGCKRNRKVNEKALRRYKIIPRVLRDVSNVQTETTLLSNKSSYPIAVAPTALHHLAHPDAEAAVANACAKEGLIMTASLMSSLPNEEIAQVAPHSPKWFQIDICNDKKFTTEMVKRAEKSGFEAFVVTVDSPGRGFFKKYLPHNFAKSMINRQGNELPKPLEELHDTSLTFEAITWLKSITKLPVVVKGILRAEDAVEAAKRGASAIIVSNHGARLIDGVCPTIEVLADVAEAVEGYEVEVYMDGGIRSGPDIFKALALGAKAVFVGRPIVWGLSIAGEDGVRKVLQILKEEFKTVMCLSGTAKLEDITKDLLMREGNFSKL